MEKIIIDNAGTLLSTGIGLIGLHNDNSYFKDSKEQSIKSAELSTIGEIVMTLVQTDSDLVASRSGIKIILIIYYLFYYNIMIIIYYLYKIRIRKRFL